MDSLHLRPTHRGYAYMVYALSPLLGRPLRCPKRGSMEENSGTLPDDN